MNNGDMPASPLDYEHACEWMKGWHRDCSGLTKREHFAGLVMQGLMASIKENQIWSHEEAVSLCLTMADALLEELEK